MGCPPTRDRNAMDKIRLQDVVNFFEYEKVREARRAQVI